MAKYEEISALPHLTHYTGEHSLSGHVLANHTADAIALLHAHASPNVEPTHSLTHEAKIGLRMVAPPVLR